MTVGSQIKQTLATLESAHATLQIYSIQSQNEETKTIFKEASETTEEIMKEVQGRLKILEFEEPQYRGY
jgi:hypothetical protein